MTASLVGLAVRSAQPAWGLVFALLAAAVLLVLVGLVALARGRRATTPPTPRETP